MPLINNSVWLVHNHSIVFCVINAYYPQCFFQLDLQGHCVVLTSGPLGTDTAKVTLKLLVKSLFFLILSF